MLHAVKIEPVRLRAYSEPLRVDTRSIVAYRAVCSCGWRSSSRRTVQAVRVESAAHRLNGGPLVSSSDAR